MCTISAIVSCTRAFCCLSSFKWWVFCPPLPTLSCNFFASSSTALENFAEGGPLWRAARRLSGPLATRRLFLGSGQHQKASPAFLKRLSSRLDASPAATCRHAHIRTARARHSSGHLQSLASTLRRCWSHGSPSWLVMTTSLTRRTAAASPSMCFRGSSCRAR